MKWVTASFLRRTKASNSGFGGTGSVCPGVLVWGSGVTMLFGGTLMRFQYIGHPSLKPRTEVYEVNSQRGALVSG